MDIRRRHPAYEAAASLPPAPKVPTPVSFFERPGGRLARTLALIAAAGTASAGAVTACGAATVNVIEAYTEAKARRTNAEIDRRIEAIETRVNGRFGLDLEEKARREKDDELAREITAMKLDLREAEARAAKQHRR